MPRAVDAISRSARAAQGGYAWLAEFYDELFTPAQRPMHRARARILRGILPRVHTACDLACGTGTTALRLAAVGIRMYAVDLSPIMCRLARRKASAAKANVRVIRADMRSFALPEPVDLILCEGDALNHVPHTRDLRRVAGAAFRVLQPGGWFYFDVNNSKGFERYWTGAVYVDKPRVVLFMRNGQSRDGQRAWSDIELFFRQRGAWHRRQERVEEICWTEQEIRSALQQAGFHTIRAWDAAPFFGPKSVVTPGCRTIYLAQK